MTIVLAALAATLFSAGTYLLLQRALTRIVIGITLLAHGANLLLLVAGGRAGRPPLLGSGALTGTSGGFGGAPPVPPGFGGAPPVPPGFADPLPQAMALTAIVISFGTVAVLLALAWRSWVLHGEDEVSDDVEDRRIARIARHEPGSGVAQDARRPGERATP